MQTIEHRERLDFDRKYITSGWRGDIFRYDDFCLKKAISKIFLANIQREILFLTKIKALQIPGIPIWCQYNQNHDSTAKHSRISMEQYVDQKDSKAI